MTEKAPLIFEKRLGGLFPVSSAGSKALSSIDGRVRVEIKKAKGNQKRLALYWSVLHLAAPILSEMIEGDPIDENMLHKILKDRKGLYREVVLPSGEVWKDYDSISFHKMPEHERAEYVTWALAALSKWTGIDVTTLRKEAEAA